MSFAPGSNFLGLKFVDKTDDTTVNHTNGSDKQVITPPENQIYLLKSIRYKAEDPSGSTSGSHRIEGLFDNSTTQFTQDNQQFRVVGNTGTDVQIVYNELSGSTETPSDALAQTNICTNVIMFNNDNPLTLYYLNQTDADQTGSRVAEMLFAVYKSVI